MLTLSLNSLFSFTNATPSSRNMIEGQNVVNSGMIILCGASNRTREKIEIYSLCLQTSALSSEPHTITGVFLINDIIENEVSIENMTCSCKAGESHSCKHIVAVLLFCSRMNLNTLEVISSTDKKCLWSKHKIPVLEQFQALPTNTFCCVKADRIPSLSEETQGMIRKRLIECDSESAISKHRNRQGSAARKPLGELDENKNIQKSKIRFPVSSVDNSKGSEVDNNAQSQDFINQIIQNSKTSEIILDLKKEITVMDDCCRKIYNNQVLCESVLTTAIKTKETISRWKKERKFRITGSRCYSLFTYSKGNWKEKSRKYFWPKEFTNKYTKHGNKYESIAREVYKNETHSHVEECGLIVAESKPWAAYSPDGIVIKNSNFKLLEIKCPYDLTDTSEKTLIKNCKFLCLKNKELQLKEKHQYYGQVQFGMAVLNLKICDFVIYSSVSNSIRILNVQLDVNYAKNLLETLKKRYFEKMLHEICCNSRESENLVRERKRIHI